MTNHSLVNRIAASVIASALSFFFLGNARAVEVFDMEAILDPSTLDIEVLEDWHPVDGPVATRQKLVSINVGEMWPGQDYRVPVRMIVPADRKAKGFHLTGGHTPKKLNIEFRLDTVKQKLIKGGVGLVYTVVQEPGSYGERELGHESERRFAESLNPRHKIQYWAWPATLMRAITTAFAESDHFEPGKVAVSGGSKNGASPSMAIIHDQRMTAVHATVSPIWDSPLRLCDPDARTRHLENGGKQRGFSGGHFGPNFNQRALDAGHSWEELEKFATAISDDVFISRNLKQLRERNVDMLFHPGTHDFVAYDLAWGGKHHPDIPLYLGANTGHGKKGHPELEREQDNLAAFLLRHFFPEAVEPLLESPKVETQVDGDSLHVTVRFPEGSKEEIGRIWWILNRAPDGSPGYLQEMIPSENSKAMTRNSETGAWQVTIPFESDADRIDFFSNHRKTLEFEDYTFPTYLSTRYTRVER